MKFHFGDNSRILRCIARFPASRLVASTPGFPLSRRPVIFCETAQTFIISILANFGINVLTVSQLNEPYPLPSGVSYGHRNATFLY
jgi:hypothetical protein